ncbi:hypothetical protein LI82_12785 [Methanococcoides methylutens]|uniref:Uncharacterized protein n=1 Tax=Methanococcoides methylutens TaxID=2226 RepID=A0A099T0N8_METMT|nr:hypothetical protein [Methanococcoides methylutens]KGK97648.1 hypothetical protein LI82_12785 [Methanococcoides methylutens]
MDTLTVIGIAILAFVLIVAVTAMNLKAASSFKKEASESSSSASGSDNALDNDEDEEMSGDMV